jgi:hypothetical protein
MLSLGIAQDADSKSPHLELGFISPIEENISDATAAIAAIRLRSVGLRDEQSAGGNEKVSQGIGSDSLAPRQCPSSRAGMHQSDVS